MSEIDAIAEAICEASTAGRMFPWSSLDEPLRDPWRQMATAALTALSAVRTITTADQIDALPVGSVVRTVEGRVAKKIGHNRWSAADDDELDLTSGELYDLPVMLIYHPDWSNA